MSNVYLGDKPTKTTTVVNEDEIPLLDSQDLSSGRKKVKKVTVANLKASIGGVQSVVAGSGVSVDDTDPANPIVSASGAKKFLAFVNQPNPGVDEPTLTIFRNDYGVTPVFSRTPDPVIGAYTLSFAGVESGIFDPNTTVLKPTVILDATDQILFANCALYQFAPMVEFTIGVVDSQLNSINPATTLLGNTQTQWLIEIETQ